MKNNAQSSNKGSRASANRPHTKSAGKSLPAPKPLQLKSEEEETEQSSYTPVSEKIQDNNSIPSNHAPVQRKVFVQGILWGYNELKDAKNDENVKRLIDYPLPMYFKNKAEVLKYSKGETDNIGRVQSGGKDTWIRLHENDLYVLGENHTQTTTGDIVRATKTDKFMYEPYTESPTDQPNNEALNAEMNAKKTEFNTSFGAKENGMSHEAESFLPKAARGVSGIQISDSYISCTDTEGRLLKWAILYAAEAENQTTLRAFYNTNAALLNTIASGLSNTKLEKIDGVNSNKPILQNFLDTFHTHAMQKAAEEKASLAPDDRAAFDTNYQKIRQYGKASTDQAEEARDISMFKHILAAKQSGYLIYGLGEIHRERMAALLDSKNIKHLKIEDYIKQQSRI